MSTMIVDYNTYVIDVESVKCPHLVGMTSCLLDGRGPPESLCVCSITNSRVGLERSVSALAWRQTESD